MEVFESIFTMKTKPDVYVLDVELPIRNLSRLAQENGFQFFYLDGHTIQTSADFFRQAQHVMKFPDYFGKNWAAASDCMRDLSFWWTPDKGYLLLYGHFENFASNDSEDFHICIEVLNDVVEFWRDTDTPFYALLSGERALISNVKTLGPE